MIDSCGYIFTGHLTPNSAEEWVSAEMPGFDSQADAVIRGLVVGLENGPIEGHVSLLVTASSVHGTTDANEGDIVKVVIGNVVSPGTLGGASWKDDTEAIVPTKGPSFGPYIQPNDGCDPVVIGDGSTADLVQGFGAVSGPTGTLWGSSDLDELEESALQGLP